MTKNSFRTLAFSGLFCALVLLFTMYIKIPIPNGYIHAGDAAIYAFAYTVGGPYCIFGAAAASALSDLLTGYALYAIPTFIIKGFIAFIAYMGFRRFKNAPGMLLVMAIAGLVMVAGYFAFEWPALGIAAALVDLPLNLIQAVGGAIIAWPMLLIIKEYKKEWN